MVAKLSVIIPAAAYAMVFSWQVIIKIPIPRLFTEYYHLNTQQIGLQYISLIIGSVIG